LQIDYGLAQKLLGILSTKCPVFMGLLRTDYAKLFLYDPLGSEMGVRWEIVEDVSGRRLRRDWLSYVQHVNVGCTISEVVLGLVFQRRK